MSAKFLNSWVSPYAYLTAMMNERDQLLRKSLVLRPPFVLGPCIWFWLLKYTGKYVIQVGQTYV
jgi:hypothetical protein